MEQKQSFNLNADFFNGFTSLYMNLVYVIIFIYLFIMVINFLRDKFINKEPLSQKNDITDLLKILYKLFFFSGFGFMIGNILNYIVTQPARNRSSIVPTMNLSSDWDYLTFGIILIFIGLGFKAAWKIINKEK